MNNRCICKDPMIGVNNYCAVCTLEYDPDYIPDDKVIETIVGWCLKDEWWQKEMLGGHYYKTLSLDEYGYEYFFNEGIIKLAAKEAQCRLKLSLTSFLMHFETMKVCVNKLGVDPVEYVNDYLSVAARTKNRLDYYRKTFVRPYFECKNE